MLDNEALAVINAAALQANEHPQAPLVPVEYLDPEGPQAIADPSRLRARPIEDRLAECGVDRGRVTREQRNVSDVPGTTQESQRVDIVVRPACAAWRLVIRRGPLTRAFCEAPPWFKSIAEKNRVRVDCDHRSGLVTRWGDRQPRSLPPHPSQTGERSRAPRRL